MTATVEAGAQLQMAMRLMGRIFILITTEKKYEIFMTFSKIFACQMYTNSDSRIITID